MFLKRDLNFTDNIYAPTFELVVTYRILQFHVSFILTKKVAVACFLCFALCASRYDSG